MKNLTFLTIVIICFACGPKKEAGLSKYVNPFIGTGGHGHTYPGACLPFGMVQAGPDTRLEGWDGCSGYHYSDTVIFGFSHTHLSGTGCSDYGDILLMPTTGPVCAFNGYPDHLDEGYSSGFSHDKETARPGYYSVMLKRYGILAELTATQRAALHRYTFPEDVQRNIILDLTHRDEVLKSELVIENNSAIKGFRRSKAWAKDQILYFYIEFSEPFIESGIFENDSLTGKDQANSDNIKAFFTFNPGNDDPVIVRIGISLTSVDAAKDNLSSDINCYDFDKYYTNAIDIWDQHLGKIEAEGDSLALTKFYTALYHTYLAPNIANDADGSYRGMDKEVRSCDHNYYSVFSLWDTYRALHPLMTILEPEETNNFIRTFLLMYQQGGLLPVWELASNETFCMIGYHAVPVIFDAYSKGIRDYDEDLAFEAMKNSAMQEHLGLASLKKNGFVAADDEGESVSKTLEYAYDDWCIAMMAKEKGNNEDYKYFLQRAQAWKHIYDDRSGFMRARMNGSWFSPFDPSEVNFNYTEANSWQYSFYVPQDISGLISFMGGKAAFEAKLDSLFSADSRTTGREQPDITGLIGQYAHGNEPSHHMAYLYNFVGKPYKTQEIVTRIVNEMYSSGTDGICGNEDCGQMSAWYVFSVLGFYPVTPGSDNYIIGRPFLPKAVINLDNGNKFIIIAQNLSKQNNYIASITLNGKTYEKSYISHSDIINGGELVFVMSNKPGKIGIADDDIPVTEIKDFSVVPAPYINTQARAFKGKEEITIGTSCKDCKAFFSEDGSIPDTSSIEYSEPFTVDRDITIKAISVNPAGIVSPVTETKLFCIPRNMSVKLVSKYSPQYSAGGNIALIDRVRGGYNFRNGTWQGYQGKDVIVVIDLGKTTTIKKIGAGFLQDTGPWILFPSYVKLYLSNDGKVFKEIARIKNDTPKSKWDPIIKDFSAEFKPQRTRYIKMVADYPGDLPLWHPGAGSPSFIFTDEVFWE